MEAPDRSRRVLAALVREYITSGEPVASSLLVTAAGLGVSSATVRNILARLEEEGYVQQPHTSAGRVPTDRGYRFYVDLLLESHRPVESEEGEVEARLRRETGDAPLADDLLSQVSHMLSTQSHHVGFALSPARADARLHKIEFVSVAAAKVMVVIVALGGHVSQKIVDIGEPLSPEDLRRSAEYVNRELTGMPLLQVRDALLARL